MLRSDLPKHIPPIALELFIDMVASSIKASIITDGLLQADHFEAAKITSSQAAGELQGLMASLSDMKAQSIAEQERRKVLEKSMRDAVKDISTPRAPEAPAIESVPDTQTPAG